MVGPGDVLTFSQGRTIRVIRVAAIGERRGPASEAQELYVDLSQQGPEAAEHRVDGRGSGDARRGRLE